MSAPPARQTILFFNQCSGMQWLQPACGHTAWSCRRIAYSCCMRAPGVANSSRCAAVQTRSCSRRRPQVKHTQGFKKPHLLHVRFSSPNAYFAKVFRLLDMASMTVTLSLGGRAPAVVQSEEHVALLEKRRWAVGSACRAKSPAGCVCFMHAHRNQSAPIESFYRGNTLSRLSSVSSAGTKSLAMQQ